MEVAHRRLFTQVTRPDPAIFFKRGEQGDPRLGEQVSSEYADYETADAVIVGCAQDEGVRRNGGRPGAAKAPDAIRALLYRLIALPRVRLFDLGNTQTGDCLEETHALHQRVMSEVLADGKRVVSLGGGNDIAYPDCAALAEAGGELLAFNIDAHLDVRENAVRNSGTPYRMLLEEGLLKGDNFWEIGYQSFAVAPAHLKYLDQKGAHAKSVDDLRRDGVAETVAAILERSRAEKIFWGIDMDVVRAADAPGVSAPNPTGIAGDELCAIAALAGGDGRSRVFEITEVNPDFDQDSRTARLAAVAVFQFLRGKHDD